MTHDVEDKVQQALVASREQVADSLDALRQAVRDRTGARVERRIWALPLAAAAVGLSLALLLRRRGRPPRGPRRPRRP